MHFLRSLLLENYWYISQIFRMGMIFLYMSSNILFSRFLLEVAISVGKIINMLRENPKELREKGDENDARFV